MCHMLVDFELFEMASRKSNVFRVQDILVAIPAWKVAVENIYSIVDNGGNMYIWDFLCKM